jgi:hypothetical protein
MTFQTFQTASLIARPRRQQKSVTKENGEQQQQHQQQTFEDTK